MSQDEDLVSVERLGLRMVREETVDLPGSWVRNADEAAAVAAHLGDRPVEFLIAILVDGRGRVTGVTTIAQVGLHGCSVTARDVLRAVLVGQASAFVLAHNHPSGDSAPSEQDREFTRKLDEAANVVDPGGCVTIRSPVLVRMGRGQVRTVRADPCGVSVRLHGRVVAGGIARLSGSAWTVRAFSCIRF